MANKKKPAAKGGKGTKKEAKPYHYAKAYDVSGSALKRTRKSCPKCGDGVWLAGHKDRGTCGKCGYMEKQQKSQ